MRRAQLIVILVLLLPVAGSAQEGEAPGATVESGEPVFGEDLLELGETIRFGLKLHLGGGGNFEGDWNGQGSAEWNQDDDMEATVGFALLGDFSIIRHLSVGFNVGFYWFQNDDMKDDNIDRNAWIDFSPVVKGHYRFLKGQLEAYVKFLLGLTIAVPSNDAEEDYGIKTGAGWNVGLLFGASYLLWKGLGVFVEIGWMGHGGKNDFNNFGLLGDGEVDYSVHQFAFNIGAFYSL